jgi:hypothetical protein
LNDAIVDSSEVAAFPSLHHNHSLMDNGLYHVLSDSGCEQYIEMTVMLTGRVELLPKLDRAGRKRYQHYVANRAVIYHQATGNVRWKGAAERERCKVERTANGRWEQVEQYKTAMLMGDEFPPGVFIHPNLTGRSDALLVPIDGARRLMAYLEASKPMIPAVVVSLQTD